MSKIRAIADALILARHPHSAWLHLRWHWQGKQNRRIRRELRQAFSDKFYLETYPELRKLKIGPVRHYILKGWKEGKDPCELFSTTAYLKMYGDVREAKVNPFYHYLAFGKQEGRAASISMAGRGTLSQPDSLLMVPPVPTREEWAAMPKAVVDPPTAPAVNVVIPVYRSLRHTAATIHSVLTAKNRTRFECLVIDDCSPEPEVSALLAELAAAGQIRLLVNEQNLGFVRSVNRGMAENPNRDVVLLNSDTWVSEGWLDRLMAPLRDDPHIATVTPLSNNATIASYPNNAIDNAYELEADSGTIDRLAAEANGSTVVDVPTGVGFCMAVRRAAINEIGVFDAETFGLGYGEECDFCMRALKAGWRNVVATGIYVRHYGSASFGPSQLARSADAQKLLAQKHPDYVGRVGRHIYADPILSSRILLDVARMKEALGPISVLFFSHTRGGGIDTYLRNTRVTMRANGLRDVVDRAILIQHQVDGFVKIKTFGAKPMPYLPNFQGLNLKRHNTLLARIIELLDPELIHMNSFAGLRLDSIDKLMTAIEGSGKPYWHVWHDHQPLCPRLTFLDAEDRYCGETDASRCHSCLRATPADIEWVEIEDWRDRFRHYLAGAETISVPSEAAALRARRLAHVSKVHVHPPPRASGGRCRGRRAQDTRGRQAPHPDPRRDRPAQGVLPAARDVARHQEPQSAAAPRDRRLHLGPRDRDERELHRLRQVPGRLGCGAQDPQAAAGRVPLLVDLAGDLRLHAERRDGAVAPRGVVRHRRPGRTARRLRSRRGASRASDGGPRRGQRRAARARPRRAVGRRREDRVRARLCAQCALPEGAT